MLSAAPSDGTDANASSAPDPRGDRIARFKHLTEHLLPALARQRRWPICLDHCFKRICLDHAFKDIWYRHLPKPAERHLTGDPLARALGCAESLETGDLDLLHIRNAASLRYRGKQTSPINPAELPQP